MSFNSPLRDFWLVIVTFGTFLIALYKFCMRESVYEKKKMTTVSHHTWQKVGEKSHHITRVVIAERRNYVMIIARRGAKLYLGMPLAPPARQRLRTKTCVCYREKSGGAILGVTVLFGDRVARWIFGGFREQNKVMCVSVHLTFRQEEPRFDTKSRLVSKTHAQAKERLFEERCLFLSISCVAHEIFRKMCTFCFFFETGLEEVGGENGLGKKRNRSFQNMWRGKIVCERERERWKKKNACFSQNKMPQSPSAHPSSSAASKSRLCHRFWGRELSTMATKKNLNKLTAQNFEWISFRDRLEVGLPHASNFSLQKQKKCLV